MRSILTAIAAGGAVLVGMSPTARAEEPRFHGTAGAAHALAGPQSEEFGTGGTGAATVELPLASRVGVQAGAGAMVLSQGKAPEDEKIARTSTGAAFLGTVGMRLRAYGATRVAGPWMDSNVGIARTGDLTRPAFEAHLGWDVRVARESRLDVGPFVGYSQIFQPSSDLRSDDARILSAGISISIGAKERARPAEPISPEKPQRTDPPPPPVFTDDDKMAESVDVCPDGHPVEDDVEGCGDGVRVFEDRILLGDIVHFEFDSARIRPVSYLLVRKIAHYLNDHADIVDVRIDGHADEVGTEEYNQKLSEDRANSMRSLLVTYGVERGRLRVVAHGKSQPKIDTSKPEAQNRRVELFVTRTRVEGSIAGSHGRSAQ